MYPSRVTQYFDEKDTQIRKAEALLTHEATWQQGYDALVLLDEEIVWDVSICSEMPGFPEDLRTAVNQTILQYSVMGQPHHSSGGPDFEDHHGHVRTLRNLVHNLHTIFHALGTRELDNFTDGPRTPLHHLFGQADERRAKMCPSRPKPPEDPA